jgi:hypothetical protein
MAAVCFLIRGLRHSPRLGHLTAILLELSGGFGPSLCLGSCPNTLMPRHREKVLLRGLDPLLVRH